MSPRALALSAKACRVIPGSFPFLAPAIPTSLREFTPILIKAEGRRNG